MPWPFPSVPPREDRPPLLFLFVTVLLSTACFVLSVFSTLSCDFVRRSTSLDPDVRYVLPYELEQRLAYHDLAGFTGIGMGFWSYSAWGGEHAMGEGVCYPYHLCFLDGRYSVPPANAGIGSARTFAVLSCVLGGIGTSFLYFAAVFHLSPLRYTRPLGSVLWMACLCQAWTLVLMTRETVCGPDFFGYCLPRSYQSDEFKMNSRCTLERGGKMAIASTILWFVTSVCMCVRPWFDCLQGRGARVGQDDWDDSARRGSVRDAQSRGRQRRRSRSSDSALARFAAAAEAAEREEERERATAAAAGSRSAHKSYRDNRRRSRSSESAMKKLAKDVELEDDMENGGQMNGNGGKSSNGYSNRRKSGITEKSWGV